MHHMVDTQGRTDIDKETSVDIQDPKHLCAF